MPKNSPQPSGAPPNASLLDGLRWLAQAALVVIAMVAAAGLGLVLGVFGAAVAAFALLLALVAWSAGPGARSALSIALIGAALATGATAAQLGEDRIAPSIGQLTVELERVSELDGQSIRRGAGPVFIDLRRSQFRDGETIKLKARSDGGRVVVALPTDRCVNVNLRARLGINRDGVGDLTLAMLGNLGVDAAEDRFAYLGSPLYYDAFRTPTEDAEWWRQRDTPSQVSTIWDAGRGVLLGGRPLRFDLTYQAGDVGEIQSPEAMRGLSLSEYQGVPIRASRTTTDPNAPTLDLDLTAVAAIAVRDYPLDVGPMTSLPLMGEQVGDIAWPTSVITPRPPEDTGFSRRWREDWDEDAKARDAHRRWIAWERGVTRALHRKAQLAAGPCATDAEQRAEWQTVRYGQTQGSAGPEAGVDPDTLQLEAEPVPFGQEVRVIAVNALGEVIVRGDKNTKPANPSAASIVAGTKLKLLPESKVPELRAQRTAITTPEVIR